MNVTGTKKPRKPRAPASFGPAVIIDTREQLGYSFSTLKADVKDGGGPLAVRTLRGTLHSGDYSLEGHTDAVAVERKSLSDLFGTLGQGRDRFERELERLSVMRCAHVVFEGEWSDVFTRPPRNSRLNPKTVGRSVLAWIERYPSIHWHPCPGREFAEAWTFRILQRYFIEVSKS